MRHGAPESPEEESYPDFSTFCHISEYDDEGYASLRRLIVTSAPVTLWSPSSLFFENGVADVSASEFLDLVTAGAVRIMGRREWLTDRKWRQDRVGRWEGYSWSESFDGRIEAILEEDERRLAAAGTDEERETVRRDLRVVAAGDAPGPHVVDEIEAELTEEDRVDLHRAFEEALRSPNPRLPIGVVNAARRAGGDRDSVIRSILVDTKNHAEAYGESGAVAPFLLDPPDSLFLRHLALKLGGSADASVTAGTASPGPVGASDPEERARAQEIAHKVSIQVLELLRALEERGSSGPGNLTRFVNSPAHQSMTRWFGGQYREFQRHGDATRIDRALFYKLAQELDNTKRSGFIENLLADPISAGGAGVGAAIDILSALSNPQDPANVAGVAVTGLTGGIAGLRTLGWIAGPRRVEHWAYLYAHGKPVRAGRQSDIRRWLEQLAKPVPGHGRVLRGVEERIPPQASAEDLTFMFPHDSTDDRGASYGLGDVELGLVQPVRDVHIGSIGPGEVRGNHFHLRKQELITVVHEDAVSIHWDNGEGTASTRRTFSGRGCVSFSPPPGWSHAVRNDGARVVWMVAMSDRPYDASAPDETGRDAVRRVVTD